MDAPSLEAATAATAATFPRSCVAGVAGVAAFSGAEETPQHGVNGFVDAAPLARARGKSRPTCDFGR